MKIRYALMLLLAISSTAHSDSFPKTFNSIQDAHLQIPQKIQNFIAHPNADELKALFFMCQRIPEDPSSPNWSIDRDFKLTSLLALITAIDAVQDPNFDPKHSGAFFNPPPPPGVDAGMDPADVHDPALRAKYQAIIDANKTRVLKANLQITVMRIKKEAVGYASSFIRTRYSATDDQDLQKLISAGLRDDPKASDACAKLLDAAKGAN